MDANLKARVEATMRIPRVVEDGIVRDLRLLYEHATAMEAEVERLRSQIPPTFDEKCAALREAVAAPGGVVFEPCLPEPDTGPDPDYFDDVAALAEKE